MAQLFRPGANTYAKASIVAAGLVVTGVLFVLAAIDRSPYTTKVHVVKDQPIPFSHVHHVGGVGLDCRYCHYTVEKSSFAGFPPTQVCMNCHRQIWADSPMLEPVRESFKNGNAIKWNKVHNLPDFVYFNHSIHVYKGVGCTTCHGRVDKMPLMYKENTLEMQWCLNCHKDPAKFIRPRDKVFQVDWVPPANQMEIGRELVKEYHIRQNLTDCYTCHR